MPSMGLSERVKGARVLLVEDNPVNRMGGFALAGVNLTLRRHSLRGAEAVTALEQRSYELLLMDRQMPNLDGYQAMAAIRLRESDTSTRTRIVAMSANAMSGDWQRCLEAGMDDYIANRCESKNSKRH